MVCFEMWVTSHSRSLKMVPFKTPYSTFYQYTIVTIKKFILLAFTLAR